MKLLTSNDPLAKGFRTLVQAIVGFIAGLAATIWAVPGVPEAVTKYVADNILSMLAVAGVSAGALAWLWNALANRTQK